MIFLLAHIHFEFIFLKNNEGSIKICDFMSWWSNSYDFTKILPKTCYDVH